MALVAIFPSVIPASFQAGVMTGVCLPSPALWSPSANAFTGSEYAAAENCPLNVCCSEYGFCGTMTDFCGDSSVAEPVCSGTSATARTIGYYEGWNLERPAIRCRPRIFRLEAIRISTLRFCISIPICIPSPQWRRASRISMLKVWISIGGWSFNDPGSTQSTFSELAASTDKQAIFFNSLLSFLGKYGFDGVDLDWYVL